MSVDGEAPGAVEELKEFIEFLQNLWALTTLVCLFVVFWTFTKREQFQQRRPWEALPNQAMWLFGVGVGALLIYLGGHYAITHDFYFEVLGWESGDLRRIFGDLVLLIAYGSFFACVTRAFLGLGLREYLRAKVKAV